MNFKQVPLPYALNALEPNMSRQTLGYHYGKHYTGYVANLNRLTEEIEWNDKTLEEVIMESSGPIFNNAAQAWNHTFFFAQFQPNFTPGAIEPTGALREAIDVSFGSFGSFKEQFASAAISHFASGWVWLIKKGEELEIITTPNAGTPIKSGQIPILTLDVWEHAYYLDYFNDRASYITNFWELIDWSVIESRF